MQAIGPPASLHLVSQSERLPMVANFQEQEEKESKP